MRAVLVAASRPGRYAAFHAMSVAAVATGSAVLVTASDLGPYAPMLLALGLYAIFFGAVAEAAFVGRKLIGVAARQLLRSRQRAGRTP